MKIVLDKVERQYLYGLFKLIAVGAADKASQDFYAELASQVAPSRLYATMSLNEVKLFLDVLASAQVYLNEVLDRGTPESVARAQVLNKVLDTTRTKLEAKLAQGEQSGI